MSVGRTLSTGVTGLSVEGEALGVVGDNIANVNTVGFKSQRAVFEDLLGLSIASGGAGSQPGSGVRLAQVQQLFTQGALSSTGVATDCALAGPGFFIVAGSLEGMTGSFYTRAGQFRVDSAGLLVNAEGLRVQGYPSGSDGNLSSALGDIRLGTGALPAKATTSGSIAANLDAAASSPAAVWNPQDPQQTSNFSTALTVIDSLGNPHSLSVYFRKTGPQTWDYHVLAKGAEVAGGTPGQNVEVGAGTLSFTNTGALSSVTTTTPTSVSFLGAQAGQTIDLDFGLPIAAGGTGLDGCTQFASPSSVSSQSQNGYRTGSLSGVSVDASGMVRASYTSGEQRVVGQLAIAAFRSEPGLGRAGHNLWVETRESGAPAAGKAGSGGRGSVSSGTLEQSNVDLAQQFVDLIGHQRAFQANSKTIEAADQMLQELVNVKR